MLPYLASFSLTFCLGATAQPPAEKPAKPAERKAAEGGVKIGPPPSDAEKLLDEAIAKLEDLTAYQTDVRQVIEMMGYRFTADGRYAVGPDFKMLFELTVHLTDTTGTVKQVCDGRVRWHSQRIFDTTEVEKLNLEKLREILDKPEYKEVRDDLVRRLGFSGIVPLMRALRETQKFDDYEQASLDEKPVYVLHGSWREEAIGQAPFRGQQLTLANLPAYLPSKITLWIGQEDGWPHRVRLEASKKVQGFLTVITLEFLNPQLGVELPESLFIFEPPQGIQVADQTDLLYQSLLQRTQDPAQKSRSAGAPGSPPSGERPEGKSKLKSLTPSNDPTSKPLPGSRP